MTIEEIFASLPRGKNDKPVLLYNPQEKIIYNIDDVDGHLFMLDRVFGGCIMFPFTKEMQPDSGKVLLDGRPIKHVVKQLEVANNLWMLGILLRGNLVDYGQEAILQVLDFMDTDGNKMDPIEIKVHAKEGEEPLSQYSDNEAVALQAAEEGIVLLKNEDATLPIIDNEVLNIFGKGLHEYRVCAVGAGKINPRYIIRLREAVLQDEQFHLNEELDIFYRNGEDAIPSDEILERAKKKSEYAIMVITRATGENFDNSSDKGEFYLSDQEEELIKKLTSTFKKTIAILNVGYPIGTSFIEKYGVNAVLYTGFGGMLSGKAVVNVLHGEVNPSGKLPDTWAVEYDEIPASKNFYDCAGGKVRLDADHDVWLDTVYEEDIYVGYRYFETFQKKPGFPFGYGLSYTSFRIETLNIEYNHTQGISVKVKVENTGKRSGKEVVQVYIQKPDGKLEKPSKELIEFAKTKELGPGEIQELELFIPKMYLTSYDEGDAAYIMETGQYQVYIGNNISDATMAGVFVLEKTEIVKQVKNRMQPVSPLTVLSKNNQTDRYPKGERSGIKSGIHAFEPERKRSEYPVKFRKSMINEHTKITFEDVKKDKSFLVDFVSGMTVEELTRFVVCAGSGWGMHETGEAGRIYQIEGHHLPEFVVADGNSGVNMKKPNIGMPSGTTICASFNRELSLKIGKIVGEEAKELGIHLILAPALNIHRNPLNGRQPEYFSEDPYLAGIMAGCYCKGLESTGVGGCYKHCIGNNAESSRKRNQSIISERAIREIYFRAFEIALSVHQPVSIMTAYNAVNGLHTAIDADLIQGLFREENGFVGFVMTDWNSYDTADVVDMENAGTSWLTPGNKDDTFTKLLLDAVKEGRLKKDRLQENVYYMLKAILYLEEKTQI